MTKRWYVVHAYSGFEKSVQRALIERVNRAGVQDSFGQILVPVEEVVEMKGGQKSITERKFFPGYVLVEMEMNDETWHLVKSTPKVTGFVGGTANKPAPISEKEVEKIMQQMQEGVDKPRPKVLFEIGEVVRVKEGPFYGLPWLGRRCELREEQAARFGDHFWSCNAGGTGFHPGRKDLSARAAGPRACRSLTTRTSVCVIRRASRGAPGNPVR